MWQTAKHLGRILRHYYKAEEIVYAIQDGIHSGQTVSHVHLHVIPKHITGSHPFKIKVDAEERVARSSEEMEEEATLYRKLIQNTSLTQFL